MKAARRLVIVSSLPLFVGALLRWYRYFFRTPLGSPPPSSVPTKQRVQSAVAGVLGGGHHAVLAIMVFLFTYLGALLGGITQEGHWLELRC